MLDATEDLQIWAGYAESFDRLMTGDDWIAAGLEFDLEEAASEVCSPLVKGLYKRKLAQVEAALERAPTSQKLWSVWIRMADVVGGQSIFGVIDRLAMQPGADFMTLPRIVRKSLIAEARATNNWAYVAENLWGQFEAQRATPPSASFQVNSSNADSKAFVLNQLMERQWTQSWDALYEPLLESLFRMNDIGRAESMVNAMMEWLSNGQWSVTQLQKAVDLANLCDKPEIAKRWSELLAAKFNAQ
jgi:hypothetical protein